MAYDLEEQEQIENIKAWWKQYGNLLTWALCLVAIVVVGWQTWQWRQDKQSAEAGAVFIALQQALAEKNAPQIKLLVGDLTDKYGDTAFAPMGLLTAAKYAILTEDTQTARLQLAWVAERGGHEIADIARLRLAGILLDAKEYDNALRELEKKPAAAFAAAYAEMKGDILTAAGRIEEAKTAYREAISHQKQAIAQNAEELGKKISDAEQASQISFLIRQKLDALGES